MKRNVSLFSFVTKILVMLDNLVRHRRRSAAYVYNGMRNTFVMFLNGFLVLLSTNYKVMHLK